MWKNKVPWMLALTFTMVALADVFADPTEAPDGSLPAEFRRPPSEARPWVYWFWMNGNITREGITADLEAMNDVGIGGCLIMHVKLGDIGKHKLGVMPPDGPVTFMSSDFRSLLRHAVREADRLGMKIDMNNADGFTGSGGPWVPVEKSMKQLVWTKTNVVAGGKRLGVDLPQPETVLDFYRDVAVIAFPRQATLEQQMNAANPSFAAPHSRFQPGPLAGGQPDASTPTQRKERDGPPHLLVSFPKPYTADTLAIHSIGTVGGDPTATLEVSDDGKKFRPVGVFSLKWYPAAPTNTMRFDVCTARHFRLNFGPSCSRVSVKGVAIGRSNKVHYWEPKAGFTRFGEWGLGAELYADRKLAATGSSETLRSPVAADGIAAIPSGDVIDLTRSMDKDGRLSWDAAPGEWTILRIGYTSTGIKNHPASEGGHGLECDKMHPSGVEAAFEGMLKKLAEDSGELTGRSLTHGHIDSWEVGIQNWTQGMGEAFKRRNGYELTKFYPLLVAGHAVGSNESSERFLWDLRRTIVEMIAENYLGRIRTLCHDHGLEFSSEAAGRQTFLHNPVYLLSQSDLPMGEFWPHDGSPRVDGKAAASVAHLYGKPRVGAEAFTGALQYANWQSHPYRLKGIGDAAFCLGINHFVIHYYVHQAFEGFRPGFAMGPWGIHLDRMNTWWEQGKPWLDYLARCQHMLRQGQFVADVLYFPGEGAPHHLGKRDSTSLALPAGYDFDGCDRETLLNRLDLRNGRLVLPDGMSYRYLMLSNDRTMTPELAARVQQLVDAGARVIGPRPEGSPSLRGYPVCDQEVRQIADALWGNDRVLWGRTFEQIAEADGLMPDFEFKSPFPDADLRYIHRRSESVDFYFVANRKEQAVDADVVFRVHGRQPELWHPESGAIRVLPDWSTTEDQRTLIPLHLEPVESYFIVFRQAASPPSSPERNFQSRRHVADITGPWSLEFPMDERPPTTVELSELASWTDREDFNVKHFSGTAMYRKAFDRPAGLDASDPRQRVFLDLGKVEVIAQVSLNGRDLGVLWKPPFCVDITDTLKPDQNELEIRVTNLWPNRLIGDEHFPDDAQWASGLGAIYLKEWPEWFHDRRTSSERVRKTFSVVKHYTKSSPLLPSGLLGPVTVKATALLKRPPCGLPMGESDWSANPH